MEQRTRWPIWICGFAAIGFIILVANTPITLLADASGDDAHFFVQANFLTLGDWVGPYTATTLIKGPGYPLFIAAAHFTGLPISASQAILLIFSVGLFCYVSYRVTGFMWLALLVFIATLFHPLFIGDRILRSSVYTQQTFIIASCVIAVLFMRSRHSILWGVATGIALAWFWLTREEGVWVIPALAIIFSLRFLLSFTSGAPIKTIIMATAGLMMSFLIAMIGYWTANFYYYGSFQGLDTKTREFSSAMSWIQSVEDGDQIPYVPVSRSTRKYIYEVSPLFASIAPVLDVEDSSLLRAGCRAYPWTCGELAGGWFIWALIGGARSVGAYETPQTAKAFYQALADEIRTACSDGRLRCFRNPIPLMPRVTYEQLLQYPGKVWDSFKLLVRSTKVGPPRPSRGTDAQMRLALEVLNFPKYAPRAEDRSRLEISGWYYSNLRRWPLIAIVDVDGNENYPAIQRLESPDIAIGFKDPNATRQRFRLDAPCDERCSIKLDAGPQFSPVLIPVSEVTEKARIFEGEYGTFAAQASIKTASDSPSVRTAARFRSFLSTIYYPLLSILLPLGVASLFIGIAAAVYKRRLPNALLIAITLWALIFGQVGLISLVAISAFPTINSSYLSASVYLVIPASLYAIASLAQLARSIVSGDNVERQEIP